MVKAASCTQVPPACFMCEPDIEIGSHSGAAVEQYCTASVASLTEASIGRNWVPRAMYSLIGSFWICTMPDLVQWNAIEHHFNIGQRSQGNADLANLVTRHLVIRVIPDLRRQIERDRHPAGTALRKKVAIALVGFFCRAKSGIHFDFP